MRAEPLAGWRFAIIELDCCWQELLSARTVYGRSNQFGLLLRSMELRSSSREYLVDAIILKEFTGAEKAVRKNANCRLNICVGRIRLQFNIRRFRAFCVI